MLDSLGLGPHLHLPNSAYTSHLCTRYILMFYINIAETKLYCSEQANEATQVFSIGAIATAEGLLIGH